MSNGGILQFFKCVVRIETEDNKGRLKYRNEEYIVEAINPTDVEAKINTRLEGVDFEIKSINLTKIIEIIK